MLEDGILVAEQSVTWQLKSPCDSQHSTFPLTGLDGCLEMLDPINWLVMSAHFGICVKIQMRTLVVGSVMLWKDL